MRRSRLAALPVFHYGTFATIAGHVIGVLIPERWTRTVGIVLFSLLAKTPNRIIFP
jgi:nitrate reductase gamma subunit